MCQTGKGKGDPVRRDIAYFDEKLSSWMQRGVNQNLSTHFWGCARKTDAYLHVRSNINFPWICCTSSHINHWLVGCSKSRCVFKQKKTAIIKCPCNTRTLQFLHVDLYIIPVFKNSIKITFYNKKIFWVRDWSFIQLKFRKIKIKLQKMRILIQFRML